MYKIFHYISIKVVHLLYLWPILLRVCCTKTLVEAEVIAYKPLCSRVRPTIKMEQVTDDGSKAG
jgi:spore maturation protein SpmA